MAFNSSTPILYYNKDAFKKAGLARQAAADLGRGRGDGKKLVASGAAKCGFTHRVAVVGHDGEHARLARPAVRRPSQRLRRPRHRAQDQRRLRREAHRAPRRVAEGERSTPTAAGWTRPDPKFVSGECGIFIQSSASSAASPRREASSTWGTGQLPHWGRPTRRQLHHRRRHAVGDEGAKPEEYKGVAQFFKFLASSRSSRCGGQASPATCPSRMPAVKTPGGGLHFVSTPTVPAAS